MSKSFITITGCQHYFGSNILKVGHVLKLKKDYENQHDDEVIEAQIEGVGKIGYVVNSTYTVARGAKSAGRIYDTFKGECYARICFIVKDTPIAVLLNEDNARVE
ncbi:MAG: HIRAN domain-containing protein [Synergistaceae bacterium]|jgi:CRISPR/Cas system-associated endonuclease/helicase Cas3|nr:HIRAN domain-containing protein [Synergistaceae bacterium]